MKKIWNGIKSWWNSDWFSVREDSEDIEGDEEDQEVDIRGLTKICPNCGGYHLYACPRIKRIEYYESFDGVYHIKSVEYDSNFAKDLWKIVIWP